MSFLRSLIVTAVAAWALSGVSGAARADMSPRPAANPQYEAAEKAVKAGDFKRAIGLLEPMQQKDPKDADVLNLLGYSHRKLGVLDKAMTYYTAALKENPKHRGAHEYIGELYLMMDNLAKAEEHLKTLDKLCFFGCEEYTDLKKAIETYKTKRKG
jgi:Flp pilus assembly protein TadD